MINVCQSTGNTYYEKIYKFLNTTMGKKYVSIIFERVINVCQSTAHSYYEKKSTNDYEYHTNNNVCKQDFEYLRGEKMFDLDVSDKIIEQEYLKQQRSMRTTHLKANVSSIEIYEFLTHFIYNITSKSAAYTNQELESYVKEIRLDPFKVVK